MPQPQKPILFILGPSAAGKTTLGDFLANHGLLHINFDRPDCNGVDRECLREEWNSFLNDRNPQPLADAIQRRIKTDASEGAVITSPSGIVPSSDPKVKGVELGKEYLSTMGAAGVRTIVLYGARDDCLPSFLHREAETGRRLGSEWWDVNNRYWHHRFQPIAFPDMVLEAFSNGRRRPLLEMFAEIRSRLDH